MTVLGSNLDIKFAGTLTRHDGCDTLLQCYACGSCSAACPVEKVVEVFDPRKVVHMVALGMRDELMRSDLIWACSQCQSCIPVCPQGVRCADVIKALREDAIAEGLVDAERMAALGLVATVDPGKCVACLTRVRLCPFAAPHIVEEGYARIEPDLCHACGICVLECPAEAISLAPSMEQKGMEAAVS